MFTWLTVRGKGATVLMDRAIVGLDVGSTTVKAVIVDPATKDILWSDYQRHHTKQAECVLDFMVRIGQVLSGLGCNDLKQNYGPELLSIVDSQ